MVRDTALSETAQVTTFVGYRPANGGMQKVTVTVLDGGEVAGPDRYAVSARSENGKEAHGNTAATLDEAVTIMAVHWPELAAAHDRWIENYNLQRHFAHEDREDGRRSPVEVLGFLTGIRYHSADLQRAFFSTRYARVLDPLGYARPMHWRVYGAEALAAREAALWLDEENLTVEYQGEALSRYEIALQAETGKLREVKSPQLFETAHRSLQLRLFDLSDILWLRALRANDYAPRRPFRPQALQQALFPMPRPFNRRRHRAIRCPPLVACSRTDRFRGRSIRGEDQPT